MNYIAYPILYPNAFYSVQHWQMSTTITIHTQCTNNDYNNNHTHTKHRRWLQQQSNIPKHKCWLQSESDGENGEFWKHFWKWTFNLCVLDQMVSHSM